MYSQSAIPATEVAGDECATAVITILVMMPVAAMVGLVRPGPTIATMIRGDDVGG